MRNAAEFRRMAREALKGKWGLAVIAALIASLLGGIAGGSLLELDVSGFNSGAGSEVNLNFAGEPIFSTDGVEPGIWALLAGGAVYVLLIALVAGAVYLLLGSVVEIGYAWFNLELVDKKEASIPSLFAYFSCWRTAVCSRLLQGLYVFLWSLLFVIPGIIASYSYAMTAYVLADDPELTAREAIEKSKQMMQGNRWRLFCLQFSFIGWDFLAMLTLGIGYLWLTPYQQAATAAFYRDISGTEPLPINNEHLMDDAGWPGLSE